MGFENLSIRVMHVKKLLRSEHLKQNNIGDKQVMAYYNIANSAQYGGNFCYWFGNLITMVTMTAKRRKDKVLHIIRNIRERVLKSFSSSIWNILVMSSQA